MNKKQLAETDIRTKFITPALIGANGNKWNLMTQIREVTCFAEDRGPGDLGQLLPEDEQLPEKIAATRAKLKEQLMEALDR